MCRSYTKHIPTYLDTVQYSVIDQKYPFIRILINARDVEMLGSRNCVSCDLLS